MDQKNSNNSFKKTEKVVKSLKIFKSFLDQFEDFHNKTVGGKGEMESAGLMAYMALHKIDENLANSLINPNLTVDQAAAIILTRLKEVIYRQALDGLSDEQRARLLHDALQSKEKVLGK